MTQRADYLLDSDKELERLQLQARTLQPEAEAMLDRIGILPGWNCLDIACGAMGILGPLARRVGPTGRVVGADIDPKLLAAAKTCLDGEKPPLTVELVQDDAYASRLPAGSFDLTHVRFLFAPVGRDAELLPQLCHLTRPGGIIAVQEPDSGSWSIYPPSAAFDRLKAAVIEAFRRGGGDFDAGRRVFSMLNSIGLRNVQIRAGLVALPPQHPYLRVVIQFVNSLRVRLLSGNLFVESELDATIAECEAHLARPDVIGLSFTVMQAWGTAPV